MDTNINTTKEDIETEDLLKDIQIPNDIEYTTVIRDRGFDDKDLVIIAVTILGAMAMIILSDPSMILTSIVSGLFGLAVGKRQ